MADMGDVNEVLKWNYGRIQISQNLTQENSILNYLNDTRTPGGRARLEKIRAERAAKEAVDRPMLDKFLSELAALRAKYPDVKMFEDEYGGFEIVHGAGRQWVETD